MNDRLFGLFGGAVASWRWRHIDQGCIQMAAYFLQPSPHLSDIVRALDMYQPILHFGNIGCHSVSFRCQIRQKAGDFFKQGLDRAFLITCLSCPLSFMVSTTRKTAIHHLLESGYSRGDASAFRNDAIRDVILTSLARSIGP